MIFRSLFDTTLSPGTRSRSESERAKLSPTQLNSGLFEVFSNGSMMTVSPTRPGDWANIGKAAAAIKNRHEIDFLNILHLKSKKFAWFSSES